MKLKLILLTACFLLLVAPAQAQEIQFPITELGNCESKESCKAYCEIESNREECVRFAVDNGLMSAEEAERALKFLRQSGPGGCRGDECKTYCEDPARADECIRFAVENGLIGEGEAEKMRKFKEIAEQGGPGGCKGRECRRYCEDPSHRDECFRFAREKDLLSEEDIQKFEAGAKVNEAIKAGNGPGGCKTEDECHRYCSKEENIDECVAFGATHTGQSKEAVHRMIEEFRSGEHGRGDQVEKRFKEEAERFRREMESRGMEANEKARRLRDEFEKRRMEEFEKRRHEFESMRPAHPGPEEFNNWAPPHGQDGEYGPPDPNQYRQYQEYDPQYSQPQSEPAPEGDTQEPTGMRPVNLMQLLSNALSAFAELVR